MFEWNVDEFRLMNDADAIETEDGKIFSIESVLSRDEKKDYLNKKYDGLIDYWKYAKPIKKRLKWLQMQSTLTVI